jgi:hypothetical protein
MRTALDNGQRSPRKLLRAVIARLLGRRARPGLARLTAEATGRVGFGWHPLPRGSAWRTAQPKRLGRSLSTASFCRRPGCPPSGRRKGTSSLCREPEKYDRAAVRWHLRFVQDSKNVDLRASLAVLALLAAIPTNRLAALALAELLSRGGRERPCDVLDSWVPGAYKASSRQQAG